MDVEGDEPEQFVPIEVEEQVPDYTLPDPFTALDGSKIASQAEWWEKRRPELVKLFAEEVYGVAPDKPLNMYFEVVKEKDNALKGFARMKEIKVYFSEEQPERFNMTLLVYIPKHISTPVPTFLGYNFYGNHTIYPDSSITMSNAWTRNNQEFGIVNHQATPKSRGVRINRWPLEKIILRGYAIATIYYGDLDPDKYSYQEDKGTDFTDGIHPMYYEENQSHPDSSEWGAISAWSWGLSRALDYFATDSDLDQERTIVFGHSRLGKAALWAGANDQRFAIVISNDSGCGGAALSRRHFGETVARINNTFPHWFCDNFKKYNDNESTLPVDQHLLMALIAPRPVYVASAAEDLWADPRGEFLSLHHADTVYKFLGAKGLPADEIPDLNEPVKGTSGYHIRSGGHDIKPYDWEQYLDFADRCL